MFIISLFIELTPILELNLFGISEHLNLMTSSVDEDGIMNALRHFKVI